MTCCTAAFCAFSRSKEVMESLLGAYELGSLEHTTFRYCGKAFGEQNATLTMHTNDNTRTIKKIKVDSSQKLSDKLSPDQITKLRSVVGSLAWVARQGRPDLAYRVSYLQTAINGATVGLLHEWHTSHLKMSCFNFAESI